MKIINGLIALGFFIFVSVTGLYAEEVVMPQSPALKSRLQAALAGKGPDYKPRTRHLRPDGSPRYINRLIFEGSPYLLQHAHNPVNWYPWGDEAFEAARQLGRPILLSVGYSTCHWCHVMEEESFENEEIARFLNDNYIAIKVDREERPDIDAVYMAAVQAIAGSGGWPMTVWLTQNRQPFYGGTYFPARDGDRGASVGFLTVLKKIAVLYHDQHDKIQASGLAITQAIQSQLAPAAGSHLPDAGLLHGVMSDFQAYYDPAYGGMSGKTKFPSGLPIRLLLRYFRRTGNEKILGIARLTLEKMAGGGIYDHVGGGFHRYATDKKWLVPHFEKMLYDNAFLVMDYLDGYQVTGDADFKRVAEEILRYVRRDMTAPGGAFYSATDADSLTPEGQREEGYFFTWTPMELTAALGPARARIVRAYYDVGDTPNFEGRFILHAPRPAADVAADLGISEKELADTMTVAREMLYHYRDQRPRPLRDEKILTAWNALMISAYARAGLVLDAPQYIERAVKAAHFIFDHLFIDQQLYRAYTAGRARHRAYLNDYAFMVAALIDLYEADGDIHWLEKAMILDATLQANFEDRENGGFFMTASGRADLIARQKPAYDGAEPSGNSVSLMNLLRLGKYTTRDSYRQRAEKLMAAFLGNSSVRPMALTEMLMALDFYTDRAREIVIVTPPGKKADAARYLQVVRNTFLPNRTLTVAAEGEDLAAQARVIPAAGGKRALGNKTTAYVCAKGVCQLPATDPAIFARQLAEVDKYPLTAKEK